MHMDEPTLAALEAAPGNILLGPRCGSFTKTMQIPDRRKSAPLSALTGLTATHAESFPPFYDLKGTFGDRPFRSGGWLDHVETHLTPIIKAASGEGLAFQNQTVTTLTSIPDLVSLDMLVAALAWSAGLSTEAMACGQRQRTGKTMKLTVNYGPDHYKVEDPEKRDEPKSLAAGDACWYKILTSIK